jgi:hypothetical protein
MVGDPIPSAAIITDPEILPELVRPLVTAFHATPYDAVVDTDGVGRDRDGAWLLPTRVTIRVGLNLLMFHLLQDLKVGTARAVPAAMAALYAEIEVRYGGASAPAGRRPLALEFHPRPQQAFRFVFGVRLQPRDVSHGLEEVPALLQRAIERCRRNEDLLESFTRDYVESATDERALELVYLYEGPVYGWQIIA